MFSPSTSVSLATHSTDTAHSSSSIIRGWYSGPAVDSVPLQERNLQEASDKMTAPCYRPQSDSTPHGNDNNISIRIFFESSSPVP
jgi:hypothetical protein